MNVNNKLITRISCCAFSWWLHVYDQLLESLRASEKLKSFSMTDKYKHIKEDFSHSKISCHLSLGHKSES